MANDTNNKKILFVEDDKFYSNLIAQKFSGTKFKLHYAGTGEEALTMLQNDTPDAVILDIMLPGKVDGFGVLEKMKAENKLKDIPVIVLSNLDRPEDIAHGMQLGAFLYLVKASIVPSDVVNRVSSLFSK